MPQVVVFRNDFGGGHDRHRHVGHIALQADQGLGADQVGLVNYAVIATVTFDGSTGGALAFLLPSTIARARAS